LITRTMTRGLVVAAGLLAAQTAAEPDPRPASLAVRTDQRIARIKLYFQKYECPAHEYARDFVRAADLHDLDWRLLPSISMIESTGGKEAYNNNMFGWDNCKKKFRTKREGIYHVAAELGRSRTYRNKSLEQLLTLYNPRKEYGRAVKSVMSEIGPEDLASAGIF